MNSPIRLNFSARAAAVNTTDARSPGWNCDSNFPFLETIIFCCLQVISGFFSFTGNLLVLVAIYRTRQLQIVPNIFIASLATADLIVGLIISPMYVALVILRANFSDHVLFKMENFLWIQSLAATTFNLGAVSVDRYFAVTSALRYHSVVTAKRSIITVLILWSASCILASLSFFMENYYQTKTLFLTSQVLTVGVPLSIISYCYVFIFKAARTQRRIIDHVSVPAVDRLQARERAKHRKTAFTIGIIVGLFVLLFFPNFVFAVLVFAATNTCQEARYNRDWLWGALVAFSSSATNPWIYAIRMREFRNPMKSILRKVLPCNFYEEAETFVWLEKRTVKERAQTSAV